MKQYDHYAISKELLEFIDRSPSSFHAIKTLSEMLEEQGFTRLYEGDKWSLEEGKGYYVTRNGSSVIAFRYKAQFEGFAISASHSDYPCFKIKDKAELGGEFVRLNTEKYGGMICSTWLDRPLSVAGRVIVKSENGIESKLIDIDRDLLMIPSVAIHMNRAANDGMKYNPAVDTVPLFGGKESKGTFTDVVAKELGIEKEQILGADLYVYARQKGCVWGSEGQYVSSRALDDLQCAFASMKGFFAAQDGKSLPVCAVFDNEEVGSSTRQGAASTFLADVLHRILAGKGEEEYYRALASSFLLSCDNAHALHPNHPEHADPENRVKLNEGIVLKFNAGQKYTTDGISEAYVKYLCGKEDIPCQSYANRSDMAGGSTLGNIATTRVSVCSADVGLPQLAMHSAYESAGIKDTAYMIDLCKALFEGCFRSVKDGYELY
ncbi:MAG: M18 family aminopeptidase [Clostridia bacterium]|nr:M18 family aminopeptidase [Clostridia bacterium]